MSRSRYSTEDYVDILRDLDGEASTKELAEEANRCTSTVNRVLGSYADEEDSEVSRRLVGDSWLYRLEESEVSK